MYQNIRAMSFCLFYDDLLTRIHKVMDHLNLVNSRITSVVNNLKKFIH